jgi:hypothetical protein
MLNGVALPGLMRSSSFGFPCLTARAIVWPPLPRLTKSFAALPARARHIQAQRRSPGNGWIDKECHAQMTVSRQPLTVDQILNEALHKEQQAHDFYSLQAAGCSVPCLRELLDKLKDEECRHISMIKRMQMRLEAGQDVLS